MSDMQELTQKLYSTTDAMVWTEEWCKIARRIFVEKGIDGVIDEGWMVGWFANAMGVAEMKLRPTAATNGDTFSAIRDAKDIRTAVQIAIGAASVCWEDRDALRKAGVFDSTRALAIIDVLLNRIG